LRDPGDLPLAETNIWHDGNRQRYGAGPRNGPRKRDGRGTSSGPLAQMRASVRASYPNKFVTATTFPAADVAYQGQYDGTGTPVYNGAPPQWFRSWFVAFPQNYFRQAYLNDPSLDPNWALGPSGFAYQQDAPTWLAQGAVDAVLPMQYASDPAVGLAES